MTAHPAPADPADSPEAAENRGLTPQARQALEGLPPALAALGHAFVRAGHEIALVGGPVRDAFLGVAMGLFVSAFARTEFQAVQFMPVVIAPQLFLCGLLVSRDQLPRALEVVGDALPMSWAVDSVTELTTTSEPSDNFFRYLAYLVCCGLVVLGVAASTVPRKTR